MTFRTLLKASAVALVAMAPAGAEAGSDVGARMQALENQIRSLSQQIQSLQPPPVSSKAATDHSVILSRNDALVHPTRAKEDSAPDQLASEDFLAAYAAGREEAMVRGAVERSVERNAAQAWERMAARSKAQVRSSSPNSTGREIVEQKLHALAETLGQTVSFNANGVAAFSYHGVDISIMATSTKYFLTATLGMAKNVPEQEQHRIMQKLIENHSLGADSLTTDPSTDEIKYTSMGSITDLASKSDAHVLEGLMHFTDRVYVLRDSWAYEVA